MSADIVQLTRRVIEEVRVYLTDVEIEVSEHTHSPQLLRPPPDAVGAAAVRNEHWRPPAGLDLQTLAGRGLPFPKDVIYFYKRMGGVDLNLLSDYAVRLPGLIDKAAAYGDPGALKPPFHLLRFCELPMREMYYALRTQDDGEHWDVVYTCVGDYDQEVAESWPPLHPTFTDWLEYMLDNDGWPALPGRHCPGLYQQYARRMPDSEAQKMYGRLDALLPPVEPGELVLDAVDEAWLKERYRDRVGGYL